MLRNHFLALAVAVTCAGTSAALAQESSPRATQPPVLPSPQNNAIPEKIRPEEPPSTGSTSSSGGTLSEKLERSDGVIAPPANISPDMSVPAPVPNPGTTPVIPPPAGNPK